LTFHSLPSSHFTAKRDYTGNPPQKQSKQKEKEGIWLCVNRPPPAVNQAAQAAQ